MKTTLFLLALAASIYGAGVHSQEQKIKIDESNKLGSASKSEEFSLQCLGEIHTSSTDLKWRPILSNVCISREPKTPNYEVIEKMKEDKTLEKQKTQKKQNSSEQSIKSTAPVVGSNWLGNINSGNSPMDNSIAISNGGIIVSVANTTVEIDDINGNLLYYNDIPTFFNDPNITNTCDPIVLYDKLADRFILFFQECSGNSSNSNLCICFSKSNNPSNDGWWKYKLTGNPLNNSCWFDYPKMAISNNELYISGNLFSDSGNYNQSILYQIQKVGAYSGSNISWQFWSNISGNPFTLLPVGSGQGLSYGPGCYLVATDASGSSTIKLYDLTDDMTASNEQLNYYSVSTNAYAPAGDALQSGSSCLLDNGDCRALSGFYLNGIIHFVFHSDIGSGWNGINYNRLNVSSTTNQSSTYGLVGSYDYSYPSVSSFATSSSDKSVMIGFGRSGSTIFPEVRVVNCDNSMNWSSSTLVKASSAYVSFTSNSAERWGDYTGTARKHNSPAASIWMNGMFGNTSNTWDTWIAEIYTNTSAGVNKIEADGNFKVSPNPIVETFSIEFNLTENTNLIIGVYDSNGKLVKELFQGKAFSGKNVFSFNKANLSAGSYFLKISDNIKIVKNEKIIVAD